jgi:hypothetical protein
MQSGTHPQSTIYAVKAPHSPVVYIIQGRFIKRDVTIIGYSHDRD